MLAQFQQRDEPRGEERANVGGKGIGRTLDLSASRAYDSALEILGAYKLTGNFHLNLEIVLKDIDAFDRVTFEIEPRSQLPYSPDCRHVLFRPNANVHMDQFSEIIRSIKGRVGFDGTHGPGGPDSFTRNWLFILPFCAVPASLYRTYKIGSDSPSNSYAPMNTSTASDRRSVQLDPTGETLLIQPQKEALTGRRARKTNNKE